MARDARGQSGAHARQFDDLGRLIAGKHHQHRYSIIVGQQLLDVGRRVQSAVTDAIASQVGVPVSGVDVFVDGLTFEK